MGVSKLDEASRVHAAPSSIVKRNSEKTKMVLQREHAILNDSQKVHEASKKNKNDIQRKQQDPEYDTSIYSVYSEGKVLAEASPAVMKVMQGLMENLGQNNAVKYSMPAPDLALFKHKTDH